MMETKIEKELNQIEEAIEMIQLQLKDLDIEIKEQIKDNKVLVKFDAQGKQIPPKNEELWDRKVKYTELQNHLRELIRQLYSLIVLKLQIKKALDNK